MKIKCYLCGKSTIWSESPLCNPNELALCDKCQKSIHKAMTKIALRIHRHESIVVKNGQALYTGETK